MHRIKQIHYKQRGVALLMVLIMLAFLGSIVADFQYNTTIDMQLATNARDELQAEYNALSTLKLRALLLKNSSKLRSVKKLIATQFGISPKLLPSIDKIIETIPIECGFLSQIISSLDKEDFDFPSENIDNDQEIDTFFPGDCFAESRSEHSKIPIRSILSKTGRRNSRTKKPVIMMMDALLSGENMKKHFEEDDSNGTHAQNPQELIGAIIDWMDFDENDFVNKVGDEDRFYSYLSDSYKPKNAHFDSLSELQLVHGIDDEMYDILSPMISIYTEGKQMEVSMLPIESIASFIWSLASPEIEAGKITKESFINFYLDLKEVYNNVLGSNLTVQVLQDLVKSNLPGVNINHISKVFTNKTSNTWYTIQAQGQVGNAIKRIQTVFQVHEAKFYYVRIN